MSLTKATFSMINGSPINILDYGAVGDGVTDNSDAIQAAIDDAEATGRSVYIPSGTYGIGTTIYACQTKAIRIYGDGIRVSVLKKLADVTGLVIPKTGIDNGIVEDFKIEGRGNSDPSTNVIENTAGFISYRKVERANLFIQYCGGPAFTDPYPNTTGVTVQSYAAALLNDNSNTNNTKDFQIFAANCCGDALYVGVVAGTRNCNGMQVQVRSFQNTGFAVNAQKGFRNLFSILSAQGDYHTGVCLAADTDNRFNIQYVESGDFTLGAQAEAARNEFNFFDSTGITTPYQFNNANNIWRDMVSRQEYIGGSPDYQISGNFGESGTWTVNLYDASTGGNVSPTTVTGYYTKLGKTVTCTLVNLNNIDTTGMTAGNVLYISLPDVADNTLGLGTSAGSCVLDTFAFPAGATSIVPVTTAGTSRMSLRAFGSGVADATLTVSAIASGVSDISFLSITYFTES